MDPVTIVTLSGSVANVCYQIATTLFLFARETRDVEDNLKTFATEISSFSLILKAVTSTLNDPKLGFADISRGEDSNQDVWIALKGAIENLKRFLDKLRYSVEEVTRKDKDENLFRQAIRAFELRLKKDDVDGLRSTLRTHQLSLNTALVLVQVYAQAQIPNRKQPGLGSEITRLKGMADQLSRASAQGLPDVGYDQEAQKNVAHLKKVAMALVSNASERAESTTGSECGTPYDRERIQQWVQLSRKIAEIPPSEHGVWDDLPTQTTRATMSSSRKVTEDDYFAGSKSVSRNQFKADQLVSSPMVLENEHDNQGADPRSGKKVKRAASDAHIEPQYFATQDPRTEANQSYSQEHGFAGANYFNLKERSSTRKIETIQQQESKAPPSRTREEGSSMQPKSDPGLILTERSKTPASKAFSESHSDTTPANPQGSDDLSSAEGLQAPSSARLSESATNRSSTEVKDVEREAGMVYQRHDPPKYMPSRSATNNNGFCADSCSSECFWWFVLAFVRVVQLALAISVCVLYGYQVKYSREEGQAVDGRWIYAVFVGGATVFYVGIVRALALLHDMHCFDYEPWDYRSSWWSMEALFL